MVLCLCTEIRIFVQFVQFAQLSVPVCMNVQYVHVQVCVACVYVCVHFSRLIGATCTEQSHSK